MADYANIKYVYPPNWAGDTPESPGQSRVKLLLMFRSGGTTGETAVVKLRPQDFRLQGPAGNCPVAKRLGIEKVDWCINSKLDYVTLSWERNPTEPAVVMPNGTGALCFQDVGGLWDNTDADGDNSGNLVLSITGPTDAGAYVIYLSVLLGE